MFSLRYENGGVLSQQPPFSVSFLAIIASTYREKMLLDVDVDFNSALLCGYLCVVAVLIPVSRPIDRIRWTMKWGDEKGMRCKTRTEWIETTISTSAHCHLQPIPLFSISDDIKYAMRFESTKYEIMKWEIWNKSTRNSKVGLTGTGWELLLGA